MISYAIRNPLGLRRLYGAHADGRPSRTKGEDVHIYGSMSSSPNGGGASGSSAWPISILSVSKLSKSFGPITALKDVSLDIGPGEIRGICGEIIRPGRRVGVLPRKYPCLTSVGFE
jgi:hypothetical protein